MCVLGAGEHLLHRFCQHLPWDRVDRRLPNGHGQPSPGDQANADTTRQMYAGVLAPRHTGTDFGLVRNIGIIAGIFDHTAASLVCCIRARVQLKRDLLPSGQANAGMRKATLVDQGT